jgi:hypothetical protein
MKAGLIEQAWDMIGPGADVRDAAKAFRWLFEQRIRKQSWVWTTEAAKITGMRRNSINELCQESMISAEQRPDVWGNPPRRRMRWCVDLEELEEYLALSRKEKIQWKRERRGW